MFRLSCLLVLALCAFSAYAQTPVVADSGVVNSVTLDHSQPIAPGSIVSIFGTGLAASTAVADSVPLSTSIAGVSVTINNVAAPIRQISSTLISVQVPWEAQGTTASVVVTLNGNASAGTNVPMAQYSPGIFALNGLAINNLALALNPDGTLAQPVGAVAGLKSHPANVGDNIVVLATGLGPVDPPPTTGVNSKDTVRTVLGPPQVLLGGISAALVSATLSSDFVGAYQVQFTVLSASPTGNSVSLQLQTPDNAVSPTTTTMAIAAPPVVDSSASPR